MTTTLTSALDRLPSLESDMHHSYREALLQFRGSLGTVVSSQSLEEAAAVACLYPDPFVRAAVLRHLAQEFGNTHAAREAIVWTLHDSEDFVAFSAISAAGDLRIENALKDLLMLVGRASFRLQATGAGKPVGVGHALVLEAITKIVGTSDIAIMKATEDALFPEDGPPSQEIANGGSPTESAASREPPLRHDHSSMVYIPAGEVVVGIPDSFQDKLLLDWSDLVEKKVVRCQGFWIDRVPVTIRQYDLFSQSSAARGHENCHREETPRKTHLRNTLLCMGLTATHPVTGVDWFDAYGYAASTGKRLPNEVEWQRAAQGGDGRAYPWGNEFRPELANCIYLPDSSEGNEQRLLETWRSLLQGLGRNMNRLGTAVVGEGSESPFGVLDMSGNTWEWTSTSFSTTGDLTPNVKSKDAVAILYDMRNYAVIKGGTWTSLPEQVSVAFRGRDLITDRHFEIGFRCVCHCPPDP